MRNRRSCVFYRHIDIVARMDAISYSLYHMLVWGYTKGVELPLEVYATGKLPIHIKSASQMHYLVNAVEKRYVAGCR